jgi:hypothetical protein
MERLTFANQSDPARTVEGTLERLITLGLQSLQSQGLTTTYKSLTATTFNPHNTRFRTPLQPEDDDVIRSTKLRPLGSGGQGQVHKVVDLYNGNHLACKIVAVKQAIPEWGIYSERDFRARVEMEVNLVQALKHVGSLICMSAFVMLTVTAAPYRAISPHSGIQDRPEHRNLHAALRRQPS